MMLNKIKKDITNYTPPMSKSKDINYMVKEEIYIVDCIRILEGREYK